MGAVAFDAFELRYRREFALFYASWQYSSQVLLKFLYVPYILLQHERRGYHLHMSTNP